MRLRAPSSKAHSYRLKHCSTKCVFLKASLLKCLVPFLKKRRYRECCHCWREMESASKRQDTRSRMFPRSVRTVRRGQRGRTPSSPAKKRVRISHRILGIGFLLSTSVVVISFTGLLLPSWLQPAFTSKPSPPSSIDNNPSFTSPVKSPKQSVSTRLDGENEKMHSSSLGSRQKQQPADKRSDAVGYPRASHPPEPIPLFQTNNPYIRQRHACLQRIRQRQHQLLGPLVHSSNQVSNKHILLVDPAYHPNVGDHMITLGELTFLQNSTTNASEIQQCDYVQAKGFVPPCEQVITDASSSFIDKPKLALWHGGGNWGDLWPTAQVARLQSFPLLLQANYTIVSMPQSLHYQNAATRERDRLKFETIVAQEKGNGHDIVLTWREQESYDEAKRLYPFTKHLLVPDMAFQLGPYNAIPPNKDDERVDLVLFLRQDHESVLSRFRNRGYIRQLLRSSSLPNGDTLTYTIVDWNDRFHRFNVNSKDYFFTESAIKLLSLGQVLICDRLHAAILAYLSGIPFVYVDPTARKISKTLAVAFQDKDCADGAAAMWGKAQGFPEALRIAVDFLERYNLQSRLR